ncbi:hypothetical protein DFA_01913 [Cavenderia fasciculata]|uniref:Uncharacterized protein n=1 Tax=Cavenderia fasciculata TaxID=261658 RepID=F4PQR6_CACFS|nr:uncharacterized protein DFA_01913 [Cavenderia fasciculata]EGG22024.1 hypothetical protein DFA_01913 [Cavenderia fasciculata]|eukprot:XP_004359875.1 hypothetical protein DFA_01913 [Cavenderia fasciculata]
MTKHVNSIVLILLTVIIIVQVILISHVNVVDGIKCIKDKRIFADTEDEDEDNQEVDWWLILKIRGTTDAYLYFDSEMNDNDFKTGYFLRSSRSALGATLFDVSSVNHNYIAFNDQPAETMGDSFKIFTHEKGLIIWDKDKGDNAGDGVYIMHTMPQFPNTYFSPDGTVSHQYWQDPYGEDERISDDFAKAFPFMGWRDPFFHNNVMSSHELYGRCYAGYHKTEAQQKASDKYNYGESQSVSEDTSESEDSADTWRHEQERKKKAQSTCKLDISPFLVERFSKKASTLSFSHLLGRDINPFAKLLDEGVPGQHIYCLTLPDANSRDPETWTCTDPPDADPPSNEDSDLDPPSMIQLFLTYLARGTTNGLSATHKSVDAETEPFLAVRQDQYTADYYKKCFQLNQKHYYFVVTSKTKHSDNSISSKFSDVWAVLEEDPCDETQIQNRPCIKDGEQMYISCWRGSGRVDETVNARPGNHFIIPTFKTVIEIANKKQTITWGSTNVGVSGQTNTEDSTGGFTDHSKYGYLVNEGDYWDVCLSGGNLHVYKGVTQYTGSNAFMVCFQSTELGIAFGSININSGATVGKHTQLWEYSQYYAECTKKFNANIAVAHQALQLEGRRAADTTYYDNTRLKAHPPKKEMAAYGDQVNLFMPMTLLNMLLERTNEKVTIIQPSSSSSSSDDDMGGGGSGSGSSSSDDGGGKKKKKGGGSSSSSSGSASDGDSGSGSRGHSGSGSGSSHSDSGSVNEDIEIEITSSSSSYSSSQDSPIVFLHSAGGTPGIKRKPPLVNTLKKQPPTKKQKKSHG